MDQAFLEGGKIVNTHGIRGELKVQSWCDTPETLCHVPTLYIGGTAYPVRAARVHQNFVLMTLEGITSIDDALPLKNKVFLLRREDIPLEAGRHFVADLIGLQARDAETGAVIGTVRDILNYPAQDLYVVEGEKRYLIPDVPDFVRETDLEQGFISFRILEGMAQ